MSMILTYSGEEFDPMRPDPRKIHIRDIAHALSMTCRANGHVLRFYSVAQHSVNCYRESAARGHSIHVSLACLLHDASEAFISDITRPVKPHLSNYAEIELRLQNTIYNKYLRRLPTPGELALVTEVDNDMLALEFSTLMKRDSIKKPVDLHGAVNLETRSFHIVEHEFTDLFYRLREQLAAL